MEVPLSVGVSISLRVLWQSFEGHKRFIRIVREFIRLCIGFWILVNKLVFSLWGSGCKDQTSDVSGLAGLGSILTRKAFL